jgi:nucleoredoxin
MPVPAPACREFTPLLVDLYKKLRARGENVEVLFCSKDKSMSQFRECSTSMPWWSLSPVMYSDVQRKLSCYYGIQAIPHLVVVGLDGAVIVNDAVDHVRQDPSGSIFPWSPPPLNDVLPSHYMPSHVTKQPELLKALGRKYLLLYFSAGWSPACLQFTPHLSEAYRRLKSERDDFECLFVSSDYDQAAFDAYWKEMGFGAIPFEERDAQKELFARLGVKGIPTLVVLGPVDASTQDRPVINANARACIEKPDFMDAFPYTPSRCGNFNHLDENINDLKAIVVFYESGDDHEQSRLRETLKAASEQCHLTTLRLYWATESTQMTRTFREALRLGESMLQEDPCMVLLDVPDGGTFYVRRTSEVSIDAIVEFVSSPGERQQL